MSSNLQIIILAAGKGVRMKSALPKVLHRVAGRTLLEATLRESVALAPEKIILVIGHGEELVREELALLNDKSFLSKTKLVFLVQGELLGTGHAVQQAMTEVDPALSTVLILPGDVPLLRARTLSPLLERHQENKNTLTLLTCHPPSPRGYGRILRDAHGHVLGIVEEKDCSEQQRLIAEVNASFYAATPQFLAKALPTLTANNAQHELYLTDIVAFAVKQDLAVEAVPAAHWTHVAGANSRDELSLLESIKREEINTFWMKNGVTFEDPDDAYIDADVEIGSDSFIGAGTRLRGSTKLGEGVRFDGESLVIDTSIGRGSFIKLCSRIENAEIGENCEVGPFANLRPGTKLEGQVKVGNFVELKKSTLHTGAKANHLSYIGDSSVGAGANIGAGTITCNYDGVNKYQTKIGEKAFIGSNTSLVAPVTIGANAVIGAGSVITKDVPAGALGIERSDQVVISGWAEKKKKKKGQ